MCSLAAIKFSLVNERIMHCRWCKGHTMLLQGWELLVIADGHYCPTWLISWLPRLNYSSNLLRDSKRFINSYSSNTINRMGIISLNLRLRAIKSSMKK